MCATTLTPISTKDEAAQSLLIFSWGSNTNVNLLTEQLKRLKMENSLLYAVGAQNSLTLRKLCTQCSLYNKITGCPTEITGLLQQYESKLT